MAKTSRFDDDLLLEAVIKYEECNPGKIKATELAQWAADNIPGLEGVRDYNFTRPVAAINQKTGKTEMKDRPCKKRIREINVSFSSSVGLRRNVLLQSADIEQFFSLQRPDQRKLIIQTREQVESLKKANRILEREKSILSAENERLREQHQAFDQKRQELEKMLKSLGDQVKQCIRFTDEEKRRDALKQIGIGDETWDMEKLYNSAAIKYDEAFSISQAIEDSEERGTIIPVDEDELFRGINF